MIKWSRFTEMVLLILASIVVMGCQQKAVVQQEEQVQEPAAVQAETEPVLETEQPVAAEAEKEVPSEPGPKIKSPAQQKLEFAQNYLKLAKKGVVGYGQFVAICRSVIEDNPDTPYETQARTLLREVPQDQRDQFQLTDQELGL